MDGRMVVKTSDIRDIINRKQTLERKKNQKRAENVELKI